MDDGSTQPNDSIDDAALGMPLSVDRGSFQVQLDALRVREKAHTHESDAIATARRRLPMFEVDVGAALIGPNGPLTLLDAFEGRHQLIVYFHMWYPGQPAPEQCEGCTWVTSQLFELSYLHARSITHATFFQGSWDECHRYAGFMDYRMPEYSAYDSLDTLLVGRSSDHVFSLVTYLRHGDSVFETYWTSGRGAEGLDYNFALADLTVYGRREPWEDSPAGWPKPWGKDGAGILRTDRPDSTTPAPRSVTGSRPIAQWSRLVAGRSDNLTGAG